MSFAPEPAPEPVTMVLAGLLDPSSYPGYVGKDYEELLAVLLFMGIAMGLMVAFGSWWSR